MAAMIVIAGIVGVVWGTVLLQRGGLLAGCLGVVLVGSCLGYDFFHIPGPLPLTGDRVLLAVLLAAAAIGYRTQLVDAKPLGKADWVLGLFLATLAVSALTHDWRINGAQPAARLVFFYVLPAALYWLARQSRLDERRLRMLLAFLALFGLYLAATAIAETRQMWWMVFPQYIASPAHEEFFGRGRGPFLNPVACGLYLTAGLLAGMMWWPRLPRPARLAVPALAGLVLAGAYCTLTRSVWLGAGLGLAVVIGLSVPRSWRWPLAAAVSLAAVVGLAAKWDSLSAFKRDKQVSVHEMSQSAGLRPVLAAVAWQIFLDYPLLGCGFGQYKQVDVDYWKNPHIDLPLERAKPYVQHNVALALLTETGLVGLSLYVTLIGLWAASAWRLWRDVQASLGQRQLGLLMLALLAAYLANGMFHDVSIIPMVNMLLFLVAGVCQGLVAGTAARPANIARRPLPGRPLLAAGSEKGDAP